MFSQKKKILIIDDHPMTVDGYIHLLSAGSNSHFDFFNAYNCKSAYLLIKKYEKEKSFFDFAIIDVNLPPFEEKKISSGVELAQLIRTISPSCKIMIISMYKEPIWVNRIYKSINPEGFVSKNDINYKTFPEICNKIINGDFFYSESINESQRFFIKKNINWDENDSKILLLIAQGKKTINLPEFIPLSLSSIEKRKANIKKQLVYGAGTDKELIETAKKIGLI